MDVIPIMGSAPSPPGSMRATWAACSVTQAVSMMTVDAAAPTELFPPPARGATALAAAAVHWMGSSPSWGRTDVAAVMHAVMHCRTRYNSENPTVPFTTMPSRYANYTLSARQTCKGVLITASRRSLVPTLGLPIKRPTYMWIIFYIFCHVLQTG